MLDDHFPEDVENPDEPHYKVSVTINTSNEECVTTRATGTQAGRGFENYIKPKQVSVMFYMGTANSSNSGKAVSAFTPTSVEVSPNSSTTYVLKGGLNTMPTEQHWRIEVVANAPDFSYLALPFGTTGDFLSDTVLVQHSTFEWPAGTVPSSSTPIPMYGHFGKKDYTLPQNQPYGYYYDLTSYVPYMIRAVAKIVIRSNEELGVPSISRCYQKGMVFPQDARNGNGVFENISDGNLNIPSATSGKYDNEVAENVPFAVLNDGSATTRKYRYNYVLYVPEYCTVNTSVKLGSSNGDIKTTIPADAEPEISFLLNGAEKSFKFGTYDADGKYTGTRNILRNYIYEYIITPAPNKIRYSVRPWDEEEAGEITFN
jgi:hypothetical protein